MQTQTSNTLHNAIMEAGGKDRPPMLAPGIDNDIYSTVDACPNACKMWKAIERNQCDVTNHQVNVQFLLQLQPEWQRFVTLVKQSQELKTISYHKLYDILKQHQNEVNEIKAERIKSTANPLALVAQKQPVCHPQNHPTHYTQNSSTRSQQAATRNRGKAIVNSPPPIYDQELLWLLKMMKYQDLEAHYIYMPQIQEDSLDTANSRPIFDAEPLQKVSNNDNSNVFAIESNHLDQSKSVNDTYPIEQDEHNVIIDSLDMSYDSEKIDQNDADNDLANERELLASLIEKLKCEIDDRKNRNKFLETSNKVEIDCAKAKGDLISYKMEYQKSFNKYTQQISDLNQTISKMKKELSAHQETISILSQAKEAQIKLYKTRKDKELDKVIALENKVKVLDNIVYKTGQSIQTMNMLNNKCQTSFANPEFLKKAQRANPRLYDIGCYNYNLALMLAPESDEFLNEIDRLSREYYYADHMNAILGVYTELDEVTNLQCDYLEKLEKSECLEKELSKSKMMSKSFEAFQKHAVNLELDLKQCKEKIKNDKSFYENQSKDFCKEREQYFEIQDLKAQLQDKRIAKSELKKLIELLKGKSVDTKFKNSSIVR
nr:hypothetical protein [Tanacetum cinerariifolium]